MTTLPAFRRALWLLSGLVCVAVAVVGIFLPLVPTTPLLLLAAFCFARSSERLLRWLHEHPRFGPALVDWAEHRAIARRAKVMAALAMAAAVGLALGLGAPAWLVLVQVAVLLPVAAFIATRPEGPRS
ncbi:MAG: YbaN family protein [Geminicoccaceae bacterium]